MGIRCTSPQCGALNEDWATCCERCGGPLPATVGVGGRRDVKVPKPALFAVLLWVGVSCCGLGAIAMAQRDDSGGGALIFLVGFALLISASIYALVILYRCWSAIQDGPTDVTPGKAIGLLFVPFYNWYWAFIAYKQLATDSEAYLAAGSATVASPISEGLSATYCVLLILAAIPYVGLIAAAINFIVITMLVFQWTAFLRILARPTVAVSAVP
jgi:hypothetical protein